MPELHVKRGIEFRPDLYAKRDRGEWLDAVGKELETKGLTIKVGDGAGARDVKNAADLKAAYATLQQAAQAQGRDVQRYVSDLLQALDDVVKPTSKVAQGDTLDLSKGSALSKVLGMDDPGVLYASGNSEFGKQVRSRPDGTLNIAGAMLMNKAAGTTPTPPTPPPAPPTPAGALPASLIDNPDGTPKMNYIEKATFPPTALQRGRDGFEVEWVGEIQGVNKDDMFKILTQGNTLRRLQRPETAMAFTLGSIPVDEMRWDSDSHALREQNPFMSISIESGRGIRKDPESGGWQLQISRDTFVDRNAVHIDVQTGKPTRLLREQKKAIRVRERIEGQTGASGRTLIQSKEDGGFDPITGLKMPRKRDIRTDSPNQETHDNLDKSLETGKAIGFWNASGVDAIAAVHADLAAKGLLPDVGTHEDVLVMRPLAYKKQPRGRFHYNETPTPKIREFFQSHGETKIKLLVDTAKASANLSAAEKGELEGLAAKIADRSAIIAEATAGLKALDPNMTVDKAAVDALWPDKPLTRDKLDANKRTVVAEAIKKAFDVFAERIDALATKMAGTVDASGNELRAVRDAPSPQNLRDYLHTKVVVEKLMAFAEADSASGVVAGQPDTYMKFLEKLRADLGGANAAALLPKLEAAGIYPDHLDEDVTIKMFETKLGLPANLASVETAGPVIAALDAQLAGPNKDAFIADLAAFLQADGSDRLANAADKPAMLADTRKRLVAQDLEITHRQIECAGTQARTLAFDAQRSAYCGVNRNDWGNFLINSADACDYLDADNGKKLVANEDLRKQATPLPPSMTLDLRFSMDVQIELEYADPYLAAIDKAAKALAVPLVMEWAQAQAGSGVDVADKKTFAAFVRKSVPWELPKPEDPERAQKMAARAAFVKQVSDFVATKAPDVVVDERMLQSLAFDERGAASDAAFTAANPGIPAADMPRMLDDLRGAKEVWSKMTGAQKRIGESAGDGFLRTIRRAARDAGVTLGNDVKWGTPAMSKDDWAVDLVVKP